MAKLTDPQQAEATARQLLDNRMTFVRDAITARGALDEALEAVRAAERANTAAFTAAITTGGWTEDELRKIGLSNPDKKRAPRRRRSTPTTNAGNPDHASGDSASASAQDASTDHDASA